MNDQPNKKWWHGMIAYQIYPKSFSDSNGDGIGDLQGIISRLDYIKSLGVDIIWLSPCYPSPMADQGYDISDYYDIDPRFGTLSDMDELIAEARKRDMYVLMDLVVNHCSDEHEWFRKACEDPDGKYGNYFYIEDRDPSGTLPCNWRSNFGGSCWEPLPGHPDKQYLHLFHKKQPDLNWENPEVREEIQKNINWWLDRGIAGFRIDAIISIKKLLPFRDFAADRSDGLCDITNMIENAKGIGDFLGEIRDKVFVPRDALTVGEVFKNCREDLIEFIGDDGYFSTMFDFSHVLFGQNSHGLHASQQATAEDYKDCVISSQLNIGDIGFYSNVLENHDRPRCSDYYLPEEGRSIDGKKCLALAYYMLKGLPFIYQGQEIGMENVRVTSIEEVDDVGILGEYAAAIADGLSEDEALEVVNTYSRDNARTPFQWDGSENAGFTTGEPWLPVNPNYHEINAKLQEKDPDSILNFYRRLADIRKDPSYSDTLTYGSFRPAFRDVKNLLAYHRTGDRDILVLANLQNKEIRLTIDGLEKVIIDSMNDLDLNGRNIVLKGFQAVMLELR